MTPRGNLPEATGVGHGGLIVEKGPPVYRSLISAVLRICAVAGWAGWLVRAEWVPGQSVLLALATVTVAGLLVLAVVQVGAARRGYRAALARVRTTLRERTSRTAFLPQRDPDAAGRPRPRAPGAEMAAA
ncbi:hypothetical protein AGRA3207_001440 [Actinomadura graeca]|uniref:DUF4229 domain-containing protein n=1 Tax=Actinomadura graeca TaxID=2750812 RepID=A0ABX8R940_9ACTN|nr:DUF6412 domain-containing protein [Actinomadura graeca]QXJ27041.1 hypothetical protein AGRA3207_001440 [Actinomadura graeca]